LSRGSRVGWDCVPFDALRIILVVY